ncbi:MAG TPA: hypothetical protein VKA74_09855 [Myxococcota bacterium]|nr:hypothetical protein [Myxococcota bacterium]
MIEPAQIVAFLDGLFASFDRIDSILMAPAARLAYARHVAEIERWELDPGDELELLSYRGVDVESMPTHMGLVAAIGAVRGRPMVAHININAAFRECGEFLGPNGERKEPTMNQESHDTRPAQPTGTISQEGPASSQQSPTANRYAWFSPSQLLEIAGRLNAELPFESLPADPLEQALRADVQSIAGTLAHVAINGPTPAGKNDPAINIYIFHPDQLHYVASRIINLLDIDNPDYADVRSARALAHLAADWCIYISQVNSNPISIPLPVPTPTGP